MHNKDLHSLVTLPTNGHLGIACGNLIKFYNPKTQEFGKSLTGHSKTICILQNIMKN